MNEQEDANALRNEITQTKEELRVRSEIRVQKKQKNLKDHEKQEKLINEAISKVIGDNNNLKHELINLKDESNSITKLISQEIVYLSLIT